MDKKTVYEMWAPPLSPWSPWAKPTVFSHLTPEAHTGAELATCDIATLPSAAERCALVLNLPGVESVGTALALAAQGYQPVPLFNACPAPRVPDEIVVTAVEVEPILRALCAGAQALTQLTLAADAPPAFLLDGNRAGTSSALDPGTFDNRSVAFASDFPSAAFLKQQQIRRCVVVHAPGSPVPDDLRHALRHWAAAGLPLEVISPAGQPLEVSWPKNGFFSELAVRLFASFRLRRNLRGGFGAFVPESSAG